MTVHVELHQRVDHAVALVFLAAQRLDQLSVVDADGEGHCGNRDQYRGVRRQFEEGGVPVLDGLGDSLGEPHAVPEALGPVLHGVHRLAARPIEGLAIDRAVETDLRRPRLDTGELVGEFTEQRVGLGRVAGTLRGEFSPELALALGPRHDGVDLRFRTADDGVGRCCVHTDLEIGVVGEHTGDVVGAVLHQSHQPDVVAGQLGLGLTHQPRPLADDPDGVLEDQTAGDVGACRLPHRMSDHHTGIRTVVAEQLGQADLDGEDPDLRRLDLVGHRIVEELLDDRVAELVDDQLVDLVHRRGEHRVLGVELLAHLAVLRTEARQQPHGRRRIR